MKYEDSPEGWIARETIGFMQRSVAEGRPFLVEASFPDRIRYMRPANPSGPCMMKKT